MTRRCPMCESAHVLTVCKDEFEGLKHVICGCEGCKAIWQEYTAVASGRVEIEMIAPLVPLPETVQGTIVPKDAAPLAVNEDGCPMCGSLHIALKAHGPGSASCRCIECDASWAHRYDAAEEQVYRTNITPGDSPKSEKQTDEAAL
jgi:hypothetical protein